MNIHYLAGLSIAFIFSLPTIVWAVEYKHSLSVGTFYEEIESERLAPQEGISSVGINVKPKLGFTSENGWLGYSEAQLFSASKRTDIEDDNGTGTSASYISLREAWLGHRGATRYPGETYRLGLERKQIGDGVVMDNALLGGSWNIETSLLNGFIGVGEQQSHFRTDDYILPLTTENLRVAYSNLRYQYGLHHAVSGYLIYGNGAENPLSTELTWSGIGFDNGYYLGTARTGFSYTLNLHGVFGKQRSAFAEPVDEISGRAGDLGVRWRFTGDWSRVIGLQLSQASKDYRTTGFESNRSTFTGTNLSLYRFNESLRADFRNLNALTAYVSLAKYKQWDLNVIYNQLAVDDPTEAFYINDQPIQLVSDDRNLGQGADLVLSGYFNRKGPSLFALGPFDSSLRLRLSEFELRREVPRINSSRHQYSAMLSWIIQL